MPRKRNRTSTRQNWYQDDMANAVEVVLKGAMGYKNAASMYNVPQTTLERHVKKARDNSLAPMDAAAKKLGSRVQVFTKEQELELVQHILTLEERFFGMTLTELRKLAFKLAEENQIPHPFNKEKQFVGKDWLYNFWIGTHICH